MSILEIKVDNAPAKDVLDRLRQRLMDRTPAMALVGNVAVSSVIRNFETGTTPDGQPWKPSKRVLKHGGQTLVDSGMLKASIGMEVFSDRVIVFASREYAAIMQEGGVILREPSQRTMHFKTYKRGSNAGRTLFAKPAQATHSMLANVGAYSITIPARPYMGVKDSDWSEINRVLLGYLDGQS